MTKPKLISTPDAFMVPNWDQRGVSEGYAKLVNFDEASAFVDPILTDLSMLGFGRFAMSNIIPGGTYEFGGGSLTAPGIRWAADTDTGFYLAAAADMGAVVSGALVTEWKAAEFRVNYLTAGRVTFATTSGKLTDDAGFTYDSATDIATLTGGLKISALTATRIPYVGVAGLLSDSASLIWDNANLIFKLGPSGGVTPEQRITSGATSGVPQLSFYNSLGSLGGFVQYRDSAASGTSNVLAIGTNISGGIVTLNIDSYTETMRLMVNSTTGLPMALIGSATPENTEHLLVKATWNGPTIVKCYNPSTGTAGESTFMALTDGSVGSAIFCLGSGFSSINGYLAHEAVYSSIGNAAGWVARIGLAAPMRFVQDLTGAAYPQGEMARFAATTGYFGLNTTTPRKRFDALDGTGASQARLTYADNAVYTDLGTDSAGVFNILPTGAITQIVNGSTGQELRVYGNTTGAKYFSVSHDGSDTYIKTSAGTMYFQDSSNRYLAWAGNVFYPLTDNSPDLGKTANRWGSLFVGTALNVVGSNAQDMSQGYVTELTTIAAAATTDTAIQIPANAVVFGVSVRVPVAIPTAATFTVTGTTSGTQFDVAGGVSTASTTTDVGTRNCPYKNGAAQTIRITPDLTPAANTGRVRVTIHYYVITPPTS